MPKRKVFYSTVASVTDERPRKSIETWDSLAKRLADVEPRGKYNLERYLALPRPEKRKAKNGPGWIPGVFVKRGRRTDADIKRLYFFVGDVDNNTAGRAVTLDQIRRTIDGYEYAIHTTFSHSRDRAKYRFVLPLAAPIRAAEYNKLFEHFNAKLGGGLDPKGRTPSQLYFWPSCPPDAVKQFKFYRGRGEWIDPTTVKPIKRVVEDTTIKLPEVLPRIDLDDLKVTRRLRKLITEGDDGMNRYASRSEAIFAAAVGLASIGATDEQIAYILLNEDHAIGEKIREQKNPRKYVVRTLTKIRKLKFIGSAETVDTMIAEMNSKHAIINVGGRCLILTESEDPVLKGRQEIALSQERDLRLMYANRKLVVNEKPVNIADLWMQHEARRQYSRLIFSPERDIPGCFNLWRGFAVEPTPGRCDLYLRHIRENIADGDDEVYNYIIGFMADAVQHPARLPGVALVMRGDEGVGKGMFASQFGKLFGQHFIQVSNSRHMVGNFNAHLKDALILYADEALWAGDKSSQGTLNALITEELRVLEHKGKDPVTVANFLRLIMASNHDWIVPAGPMARRFFVVDVSSKHLQDLEYFGAVKRQMDRRGREALLHYLLNYDLSDFDMRNFPRTAALLDQQIRSMSPDEKFWLERLRRGELIDFSKQWGINGRVKCSSLHEQYIRTLQKGGFARRSSEVEFGMFLSKMCPDVRRDRRRLKGDEIRSYVYEFPSLERCRLLFEQRMNTEIDWGQA